MDEERQLYSESEMNRFYQSNEVSEADTHKKQSLYDKTTDLDSLVLEYNTEGKMHESAFNQPMQYMSGAPSHSAFSRSASEFEATDVSRSLANEPDNRIAFELGDLDELKQEQQRDEFFLEAPIKFKGRRGNRLEEFIQKIIKKLEVTIPIIHVRAQMYLVGSERFNLELKLPSTVLVKNVPTLTLPVKLEKYLLDTQMHHKKALCQHMA